MKLIIRPLLLIGLVSYSVSSLAAKPVSIRYVQDVVISDNRTYNHYIVRCSNGKNLNMSAWDSGKRWCKGKGMEDECSKKQIRIAKKLCKSA